MPPRPDISVFILLWSCNLENLFVTVTQRWDEKALWGDGGGGRESCLVQELWPGSTTIRQRGKIKLISKTVHMHCTVFLNFFLVRKVYIQMPKHVWDSISWKYLHKYTLLPHSPSVTPAQRQFLGWRYRIPVLRAATAPESTASSTNVAYPVFQWDCQRERKLRGSPATSCACQTHGTPFSSALGPQILLMEM